MEVLKEEDVTIFGKMESFDKGKFGWMLNPKGNKIELWESIDNGFS